VHGSVYHVGPGAGPLGFGLCEAALPEMSRTEVEGLNRSQIATSSQKHRDPRFPPFAFTEHGAIMAANVLNSPRAVQASVHVVRAFVRLRHTLAAHQELAQKLAELERKLGTHDDSIRGILAAIRQLMEPPPEAPKERIGFHPRQGVPDAGGSETRPGP